MAMDPEVRAAFQCEDGRPHEWTYHKIPMPRYRCALCLIGITKARLKELTDNA